MRSLLLVIIASVGIGFGAEFHNLILRLEGVPFKIDLREEGVIQLYRDGKEVLEIYSDEIGTIVIDEDCDFINRKDKNTIISSCAVESIISDKIEYDLRDIEIGPGFILNCDKDNCSDLVPNISQGKK